MQATYVATLVDEWCRRGLTDVVVCPGSRSTPLALAVVRREELRVHVRIDERSAAFFAVGRALATRRPVAVVVTSGTAAAELHAAVAEADLAHVPLLVLTADRPPELHGVGAPQTIDQQRLFASKVRLYEEPGVARIEAAQSWRPLARRLFEAARGGNGKLAGPVHLNAAFVEPFLADPLELPQPDHPYHASAGAASRASFDVAGRRVLCVVGAGVSADEVAAAQDAHWAVVGDATVAGTIAYADPLCRHDEIWSALAPEVVIRMGGIPASKFLLQRLTSGVPVIALDVAGPVADPDGAVSTRLVGGPDPDDPAQRGDPAYVAAWCDASASLGERLDALWGPELDEVAVARRVVASANAHGVALVVGSSMPVRDVEWWSAPRRGAVFSNRGANGIDGVVSTFLGVAEGTRAIGLVGDVTMLHDVSALVDGTGQSTSAVLVVSDNAGGGIFSFLSQARHVPAEHFETLFGTPRHHDLVAVARAFGHHGERVQSADALDAAVESGLSRGGLSVVVAQVPPRAVNVARHEELNALVAQWWSAT